jgi:hypothetical protein
VGTLGPTHYVLQRPDQPALDLSERRYLRQKASGAIEIADGNNYLNSLSLYFADCPTASKLAAAAPFTPETLLAIAQAYNQNCSPAAQAGRSWLTQSVPRRKVAFQGGVLAGVRYNRIESQTIYSSERGSCTDCQGHVFGGLYSELFLPSRTAAIYGELSFSKFRSQGQQFEGYQSGPGNPGAYVYSSYDYRAWFGTARMGVRYYVPLPREQQLLFGFGLEWNQVWAPTATSSNGPIAVRFSNDLGFATTTLLPNLTAGWRRQRLSLTLDGQLYTSRDMDGLSGYFLGTNFAARLGIAYRLGRNPDVAAPSTAAKP